MNTSRFGSILEEASRIVELDTQYNAEISVAHVHEKREGVNGEDIEVSTYLNTESGSVVSIRKVTDTDGNTTESMTTHEPEKKHVQVLTKTQMILNLDDEGLTVVEIAKELGLRYQHVQNTLIRKDRPLRYSRKQPDSNISIVANLLTDKE